MAGRTGIHPDDRVWVAAEWASAIAAGIEFDCEFRVVLPSGEISWVHSHSARVLDAEGAGAGYVGTVSDITARRQAEQALRETEELFRITFGSSPIGMALVDANGLIVRANRALCELTHRPLDELLTMRVQSILHSDNVGNDETGCECRRCRPTHRSSRRVRVLGLDPLRADRPTGRRRVGAHDRPVRRYH